LLGSKEPGGDDRDRTDDLCSAIAALSQLSYIPGKVGLYQRGPVHPDHFVKNAITLSWSWWSPVSSSPVSCECRSFPSLSSTNRCG
jgi:hypothetical protein